VLCVGISDIMSVWVSPLILECLESVSTTLSQRYGSFHAQGKRKTLQAIGHIAGAVVPIAPRAWRQ
jgi:hypothetical protein